MELTISFAEYEMNLETKSIAHIGKSIANYTGKQATPLTGENYLDPLQGDYVKRLLENRVSQVERKTTDLYSSRKGLENLVSSNSKTSYSSSRTPTPKYSKSSSNSYASIPFYYEKESPKYKSVGFYG